MCADLGVDISEGRWRPEGDLAGGANCGAGPGPGTWFFLRGTWFCLRGTWFCLSGCVVS